MSLGTKYSTITTEHSWISCTFARLQHHPTVAVLLKMLEHFLKDVVVTLGAQYRHPQSPTVSLWGTDFLWLQLSH